ncbi:expressed unknown protein [Seminavis robusta]|uniref:Uncharacterized protein n=1 Tax=Seminavis robusta TaxID=568900 RepID=A0A9N8HST5_9STRA|nr:expressed unknown protein [Seminavis robusta]|eukprot:Sro1488_g276860.1 n/a (115) ;mRNA; f:4327-4671
MSNTNTVEEAMMTTNSDDTRTNNKSIDDSSSEEEELDFSNQTPEEVQEDKRRTQLQDRIPLKHFDFSKQELEEIDQGIQKRFRKENKLQILVEKRKKEAEAASNGEDLVDTDEE